MIERRLAVLVLASMATGAAALDRGVDTHGDGAVATSRYDAPRITARYGQVPLVFERFVDELGRSGRFVARGANLAIEVSALGARLALRSPPSAGSAGAHVMLAIRFVGGDADARIDGLDPLETVIHHLRGGNGKDDVDVPTFGRVVIANLYPGIDVAFHGRGRDLEYDMIVAPGADGLSRLAFRIEGEAAMSVDDGGDLRLATAAGELTLRRPVAYQDIDGERRPVDSAFVIEGEADIRISVGPYDRTRTLVVDPVVSYATYLGGNSFEQGTAIAVDAGGNAYVAGHTMSSDFPKVSAFDRTLGKNGDVDAFVSKLNPAGTALVWSTYLGGSGSADRAIGIAVDSAGSAYITGSTSGIDFPTTAAAWQKAVAGGGGFVAKLAVAGNALAYSTYVAGAAPSAIAVDAAGNAYVSGGANAAFITTPAALQAVWNGSPESGFVLKLDATGSAPSYATFLGGTAGDHATSIAVDASGNAYVAGWTTSGDFPLVNPVQAVSRGGKEAFAAKVDASGTRLVYSTLLGGALDDAVNAIAVDASGNAYVAGETYSTDFPVRDGFQMRKAGANLVNSSVGNAFVAKIAPAGNALVYASFLGGEVCLTPCQIASGSLPQYRADAAYGIAVDSVGHAHVAGIARSYTFPLVDSTARRKQEDTEDSAFVAKVSITGGSLLWSTFLRTGFNESDNGWTRFPPGAATGIAVDTAGAAYVTGDSDQYADFQPTSGAFQTTGTNWSTAIIAKFAPAPAMALATSDAGVDAQTPITLTATRSGAPASGTVTFIDGTSPIGSAPLVANVATLTVTLPVGIHSLSGVLRIPGSASDTPALQQVVDVRLSCAAP